MQMLSLTALALDISCKLITLAAKRWRKGMVIILCVCLHVCMCSQNFGKTTNIGGSNKLLADFKLYKDQNKQESASSSAAVPV